MKRSYSSSVRSRPPPADGPGVDLTRYASPGSGWIQPGGVLCGQLDIRQVPERAIGRVGRPSSGADPTIDKLRRLMRGANISQGDPIGDIVHDAEGAVPEVERFQVADVAEFGARHLWAGLPDPSVE